MIEPVGRPAYQQVADDLRKRIAAAEFPVGSAIPSTAKLSKMYGVSITVVRAAVAQLRGDGLLAGQPGKGVFVRATPAAVAERAVTINGLAKQVEELRGELGVLRQHVAGLYAHLGQPYPDAGHVGERPAPGRAGERPAVS